MSTPKDAQNIAMIGLCTNICLTIIKGVGGVVGNSYALIADAIESATDIVGSGIVYMGVRYARRPADANHPYGHGKTEPMAGLAVSLLLCIAIYEIVRGAVVRIYSPDTGLPAVWTLYILLGVVCVKGTLYMYEYTIGKDLKSTAIQGDAMHHLSDAITTGVALVGTLLAIYGGTYWARATDYAAICAAMYMAYNAYTIGYPALRELLDESVDTDLEIAVHTVASGVPGVTNINTCIVRKSGFDYIVELHIQVDGDISVRDGHLVAHRVEDTVCIAHPSIQKMVIHVEPRWDIV